MEVVDFVVRAYGIEIRVNELRVSGRTVLLGRNGSGKTTLIRSFMGFLRPEKGRILVDGEDVTEIPPERRPMGYLPQRQVSLPMKPLEQLEYFARLYRTDWRPVAERLGLLKVLRKEGLSGGERQLLNLTTVLLKRPRVLLLDEPTSHLDFTNKLIVLKALKAINVPVIYVTHDPLEALLVADEIAVLRDGKIEGPEKNEMRDWAEESIGKLGSLYAGMFGFR